MKKLTLSVGCLILFALGSSFAMADGDNAVGGFGFRLGVEAGFNLANLNGPNANDVLASRLGFVGGGFINFPLGPAVALQPELLYEQKGGKYNGNPYQLDYVEVPILLDVTLAGPVGILLGPSFASNVANNAGTGLNQTDVGLVLGAQVSLSRFLVSGRYEIGLTDLSTDQKIQNGTFTFLVGLSFI
jgi:hypothetical protein